MSIAMQASAAPVNGVTTSGVANIQQSGAVTTITQGSNRAIIRWDQFDVGAGETVKFVQPSSSAIALNRIRDNKPSQIDGQIQANGQVILMNPNGVIFGSSARVDATAIVATTSDVNDQKFMAGGPVAFTTPGAPNARIINHGTLTAGQAGLVGLIAPHVENHGIITAKLGKVQLASGDIHTVDMAGDGLIKLQISDAVLSQSVTNTGQITADGGAVQLTVAQARQTVDALLIQRGSIRANSVGSQRGTVTLDAGKGALTVAGNVQAKGTHSGTKGGQIDLFGDTITLTVTADISASGRMGGGQIRVGGDYQGGGTAPKATHTLVEAGAKLSADAEHKGSGGRIILWAEQGMRYLGHASAKGGAQGGRGGFIEVSGKRALDFRGTVDLSAPHGKRGTLLLDPTDITIANTPDDNVTGGSPFTPILDDTPSVLDIATLLAALTSGDVIVQTSAGGVQDGNLIVNTAIEWTSGYLLSLVAHGTVTVNQAIQANTGSLLIEAADLVLNSTLGGTGTLTLRPATADIKLAVGTSAVGDFSINNTELTRLVNGGWSDIILGRTDSNVGMDLRAYVWNSSLQLLSGTGAIAVNGSTNVQSNNISILTDGDIELNVSNALRGTGTLDITTVSAGTTMGFGTDATGDVNLTAVEVGRITDGWSQILIGNHASNATLSLGTATWRDPLTVRNGTGLTDVVNVVTMGSNNLTFLTDGNIDLGVANALYGSGTLTVRPYSVGTGIGLGTSQPGDIQWSDDDIARIRNGWGNLVFGREDGTGDITVGGGHTFNDWLTLQTLTGTISVLGDITIAGTNRLTLITDSDIVLDGTLTNAGGIFTFLPASAGTSWGLGTGQWGTVNFSDTELANILNGWGSLVFGRADGAGDVHIGPTSWDDPLTLRTGTGILHINDTITMAANNLTINTDVTPSILGMLSGTGTLTIAANTGSGASMGVGDSQPGDIQLTTAELAFIDSGWGAIVLGELTAAGDIHVGTTSWQSTLHLRTGTGVIRINDAVTMGGNRSLYITSDADPVIGGTLTSTSGGSLFLQPASNGTSIGIGDLQPGTYHLSDAELAYLANGWGNIYIGTTTMTGDLNIGQSSWVDPLNLRTLGTISINGNIAMAGNSLTLSSNSDMVIGGTLTGTSSLSFQPIGSNISMGVGTGQFGIIQFSDAELANIINGWNTIYFGSTGMSAELNVGATTWNDHLYLRTGSGALNINGPLDTLTNNLTLSSNTAPNLLAMVNGTGSLVLMGSSTSTSIGLGNSQPGTIQLDDAVFDQVGPGWSTIIVGSTSMTGALNVGGGSWDRNLDLRTLTGALNINGPISMGANNLIIRTSTNLAVTQPLTGTGILTILPSNSSTMGIGTGQGGVLNLDNNELNIIEAGGWSEIVFGNTGSTAAMSVGARTWSNNITFQIGTGTLTIAGVQNMGANNLTLSTNSNPVINAALTGTGTLNLRGSATNSSMGVGDGMAGTVGISNAELTRITSGWGNVVFGRADSSGVVNVASRTWNNPITFTSGSGVITIHGAQNMGAHNLTFRTSNNPAINAALTGTGILTFEGAGVSTGVGLAGSSGTVNLSVSELDRITQGWRQLVFGREDATGGLAVSTYTWRDPVVLQTGTGVITISGAQTMGANDLTIRSNGNLAINSTLSGTGTLTIQPSSTTGTIGIGGGIGTLNISAVELTRILDGWENIIFGRTDGTGAMNVNPGTWADSVTFQTGTGLLTIAGNQNTGSNNLSLITDSDFVLNGTLTGTGVLTIAPAGDGTSVSVGDGQPGTLKITSAKLAQVVDGWSNFTIGRPNGGGVMTIGAHHWTNPMRFVTRGNLVLAGTQTTNQTSGTSLVFATTGGIFDNQGGTNAIQPGGGRYLVYSVNQDLDNWGDLVRSTVRGTSSYTGYGPDGVTEPGNVFLYSNTFLYLTVDNKNKIYGDGLPTFTFSHTGLLGGDLIGDVVLSSDMYVTGASVLDNTGTTHVIYGDFALRSDYTPIVTNGTMTVTKATVTVTADNKTRIYGEANPALTVSYGGFKNGQDESVFTTLATATTGANLLSNVGNHTITASGAASDNYNFTYVDGTLEITRATITVTADNKTRIYGDGNPALTVSYGGFKNGQDESVFTTLATATTGANLLSNVGDHTITASGAAAGNYDFDYVDGTLEITKATLTATADNKTRIYGEANPAFTITYSGFKNGQDDTVIDTHGVATTGANLLSNVGNHTITASGASDGNYDFTYVDGTLEITRATITVTADNKTRIYGEANPALTVSYGGFKNGQDESVFTTLATATTGANLLSNVGNHTISASGAAAGNYDFTYTDGTLEITRATITVTADNKTRIYGDGNPALTVSYGGFKNGQDESVFTTLATATTGANLLSNVGDHTITASGASAGNYDFDYVDGTLEITKATLTATADNKTRIYGEVNPAFTITYTGFKNGQDDTVIDTHGVATTGANLLSNVGNHTISASGASDGNYDFDYVDGTLEITKATLTATADNKTRIYGEANPALTITYTGFKNGEDASVIDTHGVATTGANLLSNIGNHTISANGASDGNYDFTYVDGTLEITRATITVSADNKTRIYGDGNPALTVSYSGFKNGQDESVFTTLATATTGANLLSNAGDHTITASGASAGNYDFIYTDGTLNITKATITVTADNKTRIYGEANPALTVSYAGFKNGQDESVFTTLATATTGANLLSNAGNHTIGAGGASAGNYDFAYVNGTLSITKATLTATADNKARIYGDANPNFTITYTGFKNGENASVIDILATGSTSANLLSNVGDYGIAAGGAFDNNYNFTYVGGTLSVTKATLVAKPDAARRIYAQADPAFTVTYTGFKNGENASVIDTQATVSTNSDIDSPVGVYELIASGASDSNYDFVYEPGVFTIIPLVQADDPAVSSALTSPLKPEHNGALYDQWRRGEGVGDIFVIFNINQYFAASVEGYVSMASTRAQGDAAPINRPRCDRTKGACIAEI